jgi:hypothetical protein
VAPRGPFRKEARAPATGARVHAHASPAIVAQTARLTLATQAQSLAFGVWVSRIAAGRLDARETTTHERNRARPAPLGVILRVTLLTNSPRGGGGDWGGRDASFPILRGGGSFAIFETRGRFVRDVDFHEFAVRKRTPTLETREVVSDEAFP